MDVTGSSPSGVRTSAPATRVNPASANRPAAPVRESAELREYRNHMDKLAGGLKAMNQFIKEIDTSSKLALKNLR